MAKNCIIPLLLTSVDATTIDAGAWTAINPNGTEEACFLIRIVNECASSILISFDGVNSHDFIPNNETVNYNFQTNSSPNNFSSLLKKGTVVYVKGAAAQDGDIYLAGYYNDTY